MEDKRKSVRVPVKLDGKLQIGTRILPVTLLNLSIDGAFIRSAELADAQEDVSLSFLIPATHIAVPARIVWGGAIESSDRGRHFGMGIHFELPAGDRQRLADYLQGLMKS